MKGLCDERLKRFVYIFYFLLLMRHIGGEPLMNLLDCTLFAHLFGELEVRRKRLGWRWTQDLHGSGPARKAHFLSAV